MIYRVYTTSTVARFSALVEPVMWPQNLDPGCVSGPILPGCGDARTSDEWTPCKDQAGGMLALRKATDQRDERWGRDQPHPLISLDPCAANFIAKVVTCNRHHMHASSWRRNRVRLSTVCEYLMPREREGEASSYSLLGTYDGRDAQRRHQTAQVAAS